MRWQLLNISVDPTPDSCTQLLIKNLQPNVHQVHLERIHYGVHFFQIHSSHMSQAQDLLVCLESVFFLPPLLHWLPNSDIARILMSFPTWPLHLQICPLSSILPTALFSVVSVLVILSLIQSNTCTAAGMSFLKKQFQASLSLAWHAAQFFTFYHEVPQILMSIKGLVII